MYRPNGSSYLQKQHRTHANFFERFFGHVPTARLKLPLKTAQDARHFLGRFFRSCTDRMAQVTLKNSTGCSPFFILVFFWSCTDRAAHFTFKNRTGRSPTLCLAFFGPLPFPNGLFRSQMHPFRTLKVQHGGAPQGLAQEVLRTHCRLFCFLP